MYECEVSGVAHPLDEILGHLEGQASQGYRGIFKDSEDFEKVLETYEV